MSEVTIREACSCGATICATGGRYRNDNDARNPRGAEEIVERWRADHQHVELTCHRTITAEQESIAEWLESVAADEYRHAGTAETKRMKQACRDEAHACERAARAIRNGAHNPQTPTSGDSRGSDS